MADEAAGSVETFADATENKAELVKFWLDAIALASNEEEDWRKSAQNAVELYRQSMSTTDQNLDGKRKFNILHSNVETIVPALYNSTPVPDVRRRFNDPDPVAKTVADIQERCLSYAIDTYDFDHLMTMVIKDMELPGRGQARIRYKPYLDGEDNIAYQEVVCEHVPWKHYRHGSANVWGDVPWEAFEHFLTRDELIKLSPELGGKITLDVTVKKNNEGDKNVAEIFKRARVWEIWDKDHRKVLFIAESFKDQPIREEDDPLQLEGFFCTPRPLYGIQTADSLVPVVPYEIYRAQAEELERVSQRIIILTEAVKAKAIYDSRMSEMDRLEKAEDADHIAIENPAVFADGSKIGDHIMWYPIEIIVAALEKLYVAREQIKATIYEITGVSDILRGQSAASETATAQQIKQNWGSLRIQSKQQEIQRFARDLFRLKAELFASKFEPQVLQMMTGIQVTPDVLQLLRTDKLRGFRVDIESDSTIRADMTRNQQNMSLFLQGTAQFAQAMGPIVMTFKQMTPAVMEVYSAFARNFKLGRQAEAALDNVTNMAAQQAQQPPQPPQPTPEQQMEMQKMQMENQQSQADLQFRAAESQQKMQMEAIRHEQKMQFDREKHQADLAMQQQQMQHDMAKHQQMMDMQSQHHKDKLAYDATAKMADIEARSKPQATIQFDANDALANMPDIVGKALAGTIAESQDKISAALLAIAESQKALAQAVNMPKRIIRDKSGRAVGAEPVTMQ